MSDADPSADLASMQKGWAVMQADLEAALAFAASNCGEGSTSTAPAPITRPEGQVGI